MNIVMNLNLNRRHPPTNQVKQPPGLYSILPDDEHNFQQINRKSLEHASL